MCVERGGCDTIPQSVRATHGAADIASSFKKVSDISSEHGRAGRPTLKPTVIKQPSRDQKSLVGLKTEKHYHEPYTFYDTFD
jgi:hypothetical protein